MSFGRTSGSLTYVDASAFVKTLLPEAESAALERFLATRTRLASSSLLEAEARRAVLRGNPRRLEVVEHRLQAVVRITMTSDILIAAGSLQPGLRTLDAIHLATALALGDELDYVVTYDERMAAAAEALGLEVRSPR